MQVSSQIFYQLSVVIPVHNAQETIGQCIDSILASDISSYSYEIIVVNNGSSDQSAKILSNYQVKVLTVPWSNRSRARNLGVQEARSEWIVFLDADVTITPNWFAQTFEGIDRLPMLGGGQGFIQPEFLNEEDSDVEKNILAFNISSPSIDTAACFYRRQALIEVGGFDESLPRCQDIDLSRRVALAGWLLKTNKSQAICRDKKIRVDSKQLRYYFEVASAECIFNHKWQQNLLPPPKIVNKKRSIMAGLIFYVIWKICRWQQRLKPPLINFKYGPTFSSKQFGSWIVHGSKMIVITQESVIISDPTEKQVLTIEGPLRQSLLNGLKDPEFPIPESDRMTISAILR